MSWMSRIWLMMSGGAGHAGLDGARVTYVGEGRSGRVVFTQVSRRFEMYFEFGGGEALAIINIPTEAEWEARTGFPVAEREAVLEFIGRAVVKDQTAGGRGRYEVRGEWMTIFA